MNKEMFMLEILNDKVPSCVSDNKLLLLELGDFEKIDGMVFINKKRNKGNSYEQRTATRYLFEIDVKEWVDSRKENTL